MSNVPQLPSQEIREAIRSLQRLTDLFRERRRALAREVDLTETQWRLLEEVAGEEFMPSLFARRQECAPSAVSRTLRQLLERELVAVAISPDDARQRNYRLTPRGRRTLRRLTALRERAIAAIWRGFSHQELGEFVRFASALCEGLESYRRPER
ncbi:MAG: MarR family winged helix-turn-helix transcriptional regulator [Myxococcota bacterium]